MKLLLSEPGSIAKIKLKENLEVTLWDRWEVKAENLTLKSIFAHLQEKVSLFPRDCFKGKKAVYAYNAFAGEVAAKMLFDFVGERVFLAVIHFIDRIEQQRIDAKLAGQMR